MDKIGIYTDITGNFLVIETPVELQFELSDPSRKLLATGNKLLQPDVRININNFPPGAYLLTIHCDGLTLYQHIEI